MLPSIKKCTVFAVAIAALLIFSPACFNHPLIGAEELATYLGQATDEDGEVDLELLSVLIASGRGAGLIDPTLPTSAATEITVFQFGITRSLASGLAGVNASCNGATGKPAGTTAVAFVSSDSQDLVTLAGVPATVPVVGPNATVISTSWAGLFDGGGIDVSLLAAGVLSTGTDQFFSGTTSAGTNASGINCSNWTGGTDGTVGRADRTGGDWLDWTDPAGQCSGFNYLLCVAW